MEVGMLLSLNCASFAEVKDAGLFDFYGYSKVWASARSDLVIDQWECFYDFILVSNFLLSLSDSRLFLMLHYSFIIMQAFQFFVALRVAHLFDSESFWALHFCLFVSFAMSAKCSSSPVLFPWIILAC